MTAEDIAYAKGNILIVDDTPDNLRLLTNLLKAQGYSVRPVLNGRLAISGAQAIPPDLILLDVKMPEMDGFEVCKKLKTDERTSDIPVIFLSGLSEPENIIRGFESGGADYVSKPFNPTELLARVQTHISLKRANSELKENQNKAKQFYHFISHELRTPMTVIEPHIRFLKHGIKCDPLNTEQMVHLEMIENSTNRAFKLINQILDLAQIDSQDRQLSLKSLKINSLIQRTLESLKSIFKPDVQVSLSFMKSEQSVLTNQENLETILRNLISNAAKYTESGNVQIKTKSEKDGVTILIEDTGIGIEKDKVHLVFEQFSRLGGQDIARGTGLGLYITKALVEQMHGKIGVESEKGKGSLFWVWLPIGETF